MATRNLDDNFSHRELANRPLANAEDYKEKIKKLDTQSHRQTLFVRHCKRLAQFLDNQAGRRDHIDGVQNFAWLYDLSSDSPPVGHPFITRRVPVDHEADESNKLLFLSGYPSASVLLEIGAQFDLDPEFFDTHLSFVRADFTSCDKHPSYYVLPSRQDTVFKTNITSIGAALEDPRYANLTKKRESFKSKMDQYLHELKTAKNCKAFQSIVRGVEVHDLQRFSLQQDVTILIKRFRENPGKWIVVIWSDVGADLVESPKGPWRDSIHGTSNTHFRPVTLRKPETVSGILNHHVIQSKKSGTVDLHQSATLLSRAYGASLDPKEMASDPIYALTELFAFIAVSGAQYLDMVRSVLDKNVTSTQDESSKNNHHVRTILVFSYRELEHRRDQTAATLDFLKTQTGRQHTNHTTTLSIVQDYEYLLKMTEQLISRCDHEWNVIMSEAAVEDAHLSRDQGKSQHKFTVLATIYVPLAFSCSFFGMTFLQMSTLGQGFAIWAVVTVPLFLLSLPMLFWDQDYVRNLYIRLFCDSKGRETSKA